MRLARRRSVWTQPGTWAGIEIPRRAEGMAERSPVGRRVHLCWRDCLCMARRELTECAGLEQRRVSPEMTGCAFAGNVDEATSHEMDAVRFGAVRGRRVGKRGDDLARR